jgi:hypothetical protein
MNYALDTPIKRSVYVPPEPQTYTVPPHPSNNTQDHRIFNWLYHKPQNHAIFPKPAVSGRRK